jgi:hypothetical protein
MTAANSCALEQQQMIRQQTHKAVPENAEDLLVRNLIEALNRLHGDLDRIELWTAALACFRQAAPQYQPNGDHLMPPGKPATGST